MEDQEPGIIGFIERSNLHDQDKLECPSAPLYPNLNKEVDKIREEEKYYILKDFISKNKDVTKLILQNLEKPIKSIDIPIGKLLQNGLSTVTIYKNFDYYIWLEMHMHFDKEKGYRYGILHKYVNGFKELKFNHDEKFFYISFKSKVDVFENELKINIY